MAATSLFTSDRERRLWLWVVAAVLAIYASLGLAGTLAAELRARNLLTVSFIIGFVLVLVAIAWSGVKRRPGKREIWVGVGVAAAYVMVLVRMGMNPEERTHLFEYGLVAVLVHQALVERRRNGGRVRAPALLAVVVTALLGWIDEGIQALLPNRVYDLVDVARNALAGVMAIAATLALSRARRRDRAGDSSRAPDTDSSR